eukprot:GHVT01085780.1.p1 GENE.GHVT01085780.1~~GHVT01085780.1.p1  ORF type:complete len:219 (-),score=54.63 GHVT01085780.1:475-1131(-)
MPPSYRVSGGPSKQTAHLKKFPSSSSPTENPLESPRVSSIYCFFNNSRATLDIVAKDEKKTESVARPALKDGRKSHTKIKFSLQLSLLGLLHNFLHFHLCSNMFLITITPSSSSSCSLSSPSSPSSSFSSFSSSSSCFPSSPSPSAFPPGSAPPFPPRGLPRFRRGMKSFGNSPKRIIRLGQHMFSSSISSDSLPSRFAPISAATSLPPFPTRFPLPR